MSHTSRPARLRSISISTRMNSPPISDAMRSPSRWNSSMRMSSALVSGFIAGFSATLSRQPLSCACACPSVPSAMSALRRLFPPQCSSTIPATASAPIMSMLSRDTSRMTSSTAAIPILSLQSSCMFSMSIMSLTPSTAAS